MGKLLLFAFFDQKAEAYLTPFAAPTRGHALRSFEDAVNDQTTLFHRHAEDFFLFELGEFSLSTGEIVPASHALGNGVRFRKPTLLKEG